MTGDKNISGFTFPELIFAMGFAFLCMGFIFGSLWNGGLLQEISYFTGGSFIVIAILTAIILPRIPIKPDQTASQKTDLGVVIPMLLVFAILFGVIAFVGDRQANPPEDYCHNIGETHKDMSSLSRAVVLKTGQCVKNETGFHANGKAWFP
jgi:amino acid transporter